MAKVTEKIILQRLQNHEKKHSIIIKQQFGFRQKYNTVQQLLRITNDIIKGFNNNKVTAMLLLDIEKAFDKVWIDGLIYKLIQYNYPSALIKLIHSYMTDRKFKVTISGIKTSEILITVGVPQGSILGPILFIIFINDIPTFLKTKLALFADDTAIYAQSFHATVAAKQTQIHVSQLEQYYKKWKISLNAEKTEAIVFSKKRTSNKIFTPIKINNTIVQIKSSVKYLGVY